MNVFNTSMKFVLLAIFLFLVRPVFAFGLSCSGLECTVFTLIGVVAFLLKICWLYWKILIPIGVLGFLIGRKNVTIKTLSLVLLITTVVCALIANYNVEGLKRQKAKERRNKLEVINNLNFGVYAPTQPPSTTIDFDISSKEISILYRSPFYRSTRTVSLIVTSQKENKNFNPPTKCDEEYDGGRAQPCSLRIVSSKGINVFETKNNSYPEAQPEALYFKINGSIVKVSNSSIIRSSDKEELLRFIDSFKELNKTNLIQLYEKSSDYNYIRGLEGY